MKTKKMITLLAIILFLGNCSYSQPDSSTINKLIKKYYSNLSLADGSPTYYIEKLTTTDIIKRTNDTFWVKVKIVGTYQNFSIPDEQKEHDFEDNRTFAFFLNQNKKWECAIKFY